MRDLISLVDVPTLQGWSKLEAPKIIQEHTSARDNYFILNPSLNDFVASKNLQDLFPLLTYFLLAFEDLQHNIFRQRIENDCFEHKVAHIRNATQAKSIEVSLAGDHPALLCTQLLLRCLSTAVALDHALQFYLAEDLCLELKETIQILFEQAINLLDLLDTTNLCVIKLKLKTLEDQFNNTLMNLIHRSQLDLQLEANNQPVDYGRLLDYLRLLASTLNPTPALVTLFNYEGMLVAETNYPITKLLDEQVKAFAAINSEVLSFHKSQPYCFQIINRAFYQNLVSGKSIMPALLRETIAPGAKNAYVVNFRAITNNGAEVFSHNLLRGAALAYVGKGQTSAEITNFANQNLEQIRQYALNLDNTKRNIHLVTLVTKSIINTHHQNEIMTTSKRAINAHDHFSYVPVNDLGTWQSPQIASDLGFTVQSRLRPGNKKERSEFCAEIMWQTLCKQVFLLITCGSGQDRIHTELLLLFLKLLITGAKQTISNHNIQNAGRVYVEARCGQTIVTHAAPGSTGLKDASYDGVLETATAEQLYLSSARTNRGAYVHAKAKEEINPAQEEIRRQIVELMKNYLIISSGLFGGLFLFQSFWLRAEKRKSVENIIPQLLKGDLNSALDSLEKNCEVALTQTQKCLLFRCIGPGRLEKAIETSKNLLSSLN